MLTYRELVERSVPRVSVATVFRSFGGDYDLLRAYFTRLYEDNAGLALAGHNVHDWPTVSDALLFPSRASMRPADPETAAWALFACERPVMVEEDDRLDIETRFPDRDELFVLLDAGVPISYCSAVEAPWGKYPTHEVVDAFHAGIPVDYLNVLGVERNAD